jgi:hypothetical protein
MNDLDLLKRFRAGLKDPAPERVDAEWVNLMQRLREKPAARQRSHGARRRWAIAVGVAAVAVALAVAMPAVLPGNGPRGAGSAEAGRVLRRLATVAANQPAQQPPRVGEYVYTKTEGSSAYLYVTGNGMPNFSFTLPDTREAWIGTDGSGRIVWTTGQATFPSPEDQAAWVAAGSPDLEELDTGDERYGPGELHFLDLAGLPTDPGELLAVIEEREIVGGPEGDWESFVIVGDLLRETYAPPDLRAALYEVAANLPGVEYIGNAKDASGRPGVAVAHTHRGVRRELIFDPQTAVLLGENQVMVDPDETGLEIGPDTYPGTIYGAWGEPGSVVSSAVYLDSGIGDSINEAPESPSS